MDPDFQTSLGPSNHMRFLQLLWLTSKNELILFQCKQCFCNFHYYVQILETFAVYSNGNYKTIAWIGKELVHFLKWATTAKETSCGLMDPMRFENLGPSNHMSFLCTHVFWWTQKPHVVWWTLKIIKGPSNNMRFWVHQNTWGFGRVVGPDKIWKIEWWSKKSDRIDLTMNLWLSIAYIYLILPHLMAPGHFPKQNILRILIVGFR